MVEFFDFLLSNNYFVFIMCCFNFLFFGSLMIRAFFNYLNRLHLVILSKKKKVDINE